MTNGINDVAPNSTINISDATKLQQEQQQLLKTPANSYQSQSPYYPQQKQGFFGDFFKNTNNKDPVNPALYNNLGVIPDSLAKIKDPLSSLTNKLGNLTYKEVPPLFNAEKTNNQNKQKANQMLVKSVMQNTLGLVPKPASDAGVNNIINALWDQFGESAEFSKNTAKEISDTYDRIKKEFAKNDKLDDIMTFVEKQKNVIDGVIEDPNKNKKNIIDACKKVADGMMCTFTSIPGTFFFVLYNILFRPITFFYYAYDTYLVNKKCKELQNIDLEDENMDQALKGTAFLLKQINNDGANVLNCLFSTKNKQYGSFGYQIKDGMKAIVDNLDVAKDLSTDLDKSIEAITDFKSLSALLVTDSSTLTNKFNIEPGKVIKISWEDTADAKGKNVRKFTIENVDKKDIAKKNNILYIESSNVQNLFKDMVDINRSAKEDSDFGRDMKSIVDSYESALSDKNLNITNEILNTKITTEDIGEFQQSIDTLIENIEGYFSENKDDFNKIEHINQYMSTVETHLDSVKEGPQKQIDDLKNKIESYYGGMFKTLYIQAEKILDYNKGEHALKEGLDSTDSYKDNIRRINHVIVNSTKYKNIIEFANEFMNPNKKAIDHISTGNMDLKTYEVYAKQIKEIIDGKKIKIGELKAGITNKYNVLNTDNNFEYAKNIQVNNLDLIHRLSYDKIISRNPSAGNTYTKKIIREKTTTDEDDKGDKDDKGGKSI